MRRVYRPHNGHDNDGAANAAPFVSPIRIGAHCRLSYPHVLRNLQHNDRLAIICDTIPFGISSAAVDGNKRVYSPNRATRDGYAAPRHHAEQLDALSAVPILSLGFDSHDEPDHLKDYTATVRKARMAMHARAADSMPDTLALERERLEMLEQSAPVRHYDYQPSNVLQRLQRARTNTLAAQNRRVCAIISSGAFGAPRVAVERSLVVWGWHTIGY